MSERWPAAGAADGRGTIRVLVAHGEDAARDDIVAILRASARIEVVGVARSGDTTIALARKLTPDILLIDDGLPGGGGADTTERLGALLPAAAVILLASTLSADTLQRAMRAGARQIVPLPVAPGELLETIGQVHEALVARRAPTPAHAGRPAALAGQIVVVFSLKGGVGCTTVATNLAVAIRQEMGLRVALVDASLPIGDVGALLDLPSTTSVTDLVGLGGDDAAAVEDALLTHARSGVRVLQAPHRVELAETITGDLLRRTVETLRAHHEFVVVDTHAALDERVLPLLETADTILLALTQDMAALRSATVFLRIVELLGYPAGKVLPIVTRVGIAGGISTPEMAEALGRPLDRLIPTDERAVVRAINEGTPLMLSGRQTPVATAIVDLARYLVAATYPDAVAPLLMAQGGGARRGPLALFARG